jgi:hypothetical protein
MYADSRGISESFGDLFFFLPISKLATGAQAVRTGAGVTLSVRLAGSGLKLAEGSRALIQGAKSEYFLGVIENGTVRLFKTALGEIEHHGQLIKQGLVKAGAQGFSIVVKEGKVVVIRLNSQLNRKLPDFNIPIDTAEQILKQLGATGARILGN